jgi:hypothetical protein
MERFIKYQRFSKDIQNVNIEIQPFLDDLIKDGWEIISYNERIKDAYTLTVTIIGGKKQEDSLSNVL